MATKDLTIDNPKSLDVNSGLAVSTPKPDPQGISLNWILKYLAAGGIAGFISRTVTAPIDRLKVLYQVHSKIALTQEGKPVGIYDGMKAIYRDGGIRAFWRGNFTNVLKVVPEWSLFFWFV